MQLFFLFPDHYQHNLHLSGFHYISTIRKEMKQKNEKIKRNLNIVLQLSPNWKPTSFSIYKIRYSLIVFSYQIPFIVAKLSILHNHLEKKQLHKIINYSLDINRSNRAYHIFSRILRDLLLYYLNGENQTVIESIQGNQITKKNSGDFAYLFL